MAEGLTPRSPEQPAPLSPVGEDADPRTPDIVVPPASSEPVVPRPPAEEARASNPYRIRFGLAYLALAAVVGGAVGSFVVLLMRDGPVDKGAWSSWQPTGRESSFPKQIADYVSGRYRLPSGNPLVGVLASEPEVQAGESSVPVAAVAIRNDPEGDSDDISIVRTDNGIMYQLCGLGERCSIREGRPSADRHRLLRREALELALYSFKYIDEVDSVITLLPPRKDAQMSTALFFQKNDLREALDRPLSQTLRLQNPPQASEIDPIEGLTIDRLTNSRLFQYEFTQAPAGGAILVLAPVET